MSSRSYEREISRSEMALECMFSRPTGKTFAETSIHCSVTEKVGARAHPKTGVYCEYFHCDFLAGEPENRDVVENASVAWVALQA